MINKSQQGKENCEQFVFMEGEEYQSPIISFHSQSFSPEINHEAIQNEKQNQKNKKKYSNKIRTRPWNHSDLLQLLKIVLTYIKNNQEIDWNKVTELCKRTRVQSTKQRYDNTLTSLRKKLIGEIKKIQKRIQKIRYKRERKQIILKKQGQTLPLQYLLKSKAEQQALIDMKQQWDNKTDEELIEAYLYFNHSYVKKWMRNQPHIPGSINKSKNKLNEQKQQLQRIAIFKHNPYPRLYILKNIYPHFTCSQQLQENIKKIDPIEYKNYSLLQKLQMCMIDISNQQQMCKEIDSQIDKMIDQVNKSIKQLICLDKRVRYIKSGYDCQFKSVNFMKTDKKNIKKKEKEEKGTKQNLQRNKREE